MSEYALREKLAEAGEKLKEQHDLLKRLTTPPYKLGRIVAIYPATRTAIVRVLGENIWEVELPIHKMQWPKEGDTVRLNPETGAIIEHSPHTDDLTGEIVTVLEVSDRFCEAEIHHAKRAIRFQGEPPKQGDRVIVDPEAMTIVKNIGQAAQNHLVTEETKVSWDDIGGLFDAKDQMIEAIELPYRYHDLFKGYKQPSVKGALLYGPPGCGKTLIGKAAATSLASVHGESASTGFIYIKGPELLNWLVGMTEERIKELFMLAREHKRKNGYPAILFIDEADAILAARGSRRSSDVDSTIVPMFLSEMDGLQDSSAFVLLSSNRPDTLDPAVVREGRIDRKIRITRPTEDGAREILEIHLKGKPLEDGLKYGRVLDRCVREIFSDDHIVGVDSGATVYLRDIISGAMLAEVISRASMDAIRRDIKRGRRSKVAGVKMIDFLEAINLVTQQNAEMRAQTQLSMWK